MVWRFRIIRNIRGIGTNRRCSRVTAVIRITGQTFQGKFRNTVEAGGRETDSRIDPPGHFFQQYKTVTTARGTTRCALFTRPRGRGFRCLGRVITRRDGFLHSFDVGQLRLRRRRRFGCFHMGHLMREQLRIHLQAAATPEGQFLAILQMHRHRAFGTGDQLIAGVQPVPLDQGTSGAVARLREHLTNDLSDDTDERCHVHFLRCQPLSASC